MVGITSLFGLALGLALAYLWHLHCGWGAGRQSRPQSPRSFNFTFSFTPVCVLVISLMRQRRTKTPQLVWPETPSYGERKEPWNVQMSVVRTTKSNKSHTKSMRLNMPVVLHHNDRMVINKQWSLWWMVCLNPAANMCPSAWLSEIHRCCPLWPHHWGPENH